MRAGLALGGTAERGAEVAAYTVRPAEIAPGLYRNVTGAEALSWGLVAGAQGAGLKLVFCSYPITPASSLLHALAGLKDHGVVTFQAEDEDRKSVVEGKSVSVRVDLGGRRIIKNKT